MRIVRIAREAPLGGELSPDMVTERGLQSSHFPSPSSLRDATSPLGEAFLRLAINPNYLFTILIFLLTTTNFSCVASALGFLRIS